MVADGLSLLLWMMRDSWIVEVGPATFVVVIVIVDDDDGGGVVVSSRCNDGFNVS